MGKLIDITGQQFGKWIVLRRGENYKQGQARWICKCGCGDVVLVSGDSLRRRRTSKCLSCMRIENGKRQRGLPYKYPSEHAIWRTMRDRCHRKTADGYQRYGGRGIFVCARWRKSFKSFLNDMGTRPSIRHSIDRIDNAGHYCPSNCRWATYKQQARNSRTNRIIEYNGESHCVAEWAEIMGMPNSRLSARINKLGWSIHDALTKPWQVN